MDGSFLNCSVCVISPFQLVEEEQDFSSFFPKGKKMISLKNKVSLIKNKAPGFPQGAGDMVQSKFNVEVVICFAIFLSSLICRSRH